MTGFEVDPAALRRAADAARQAAGVVRKLEVSEVARLAAALPGTESAGTAGELSRHWQDMNKSWATDMDTYASTMVWAADEYQRQDKAGARGIGRTGR
uniref:hypothetical protein n=1 Tax=Nocardia suismassiliense TaxID=2077092 RepID=UPI003F496EB5